MTSSVRRVLSGLVLTSMLGLPVRASAQSITQSIVKLSPDHAYLLSVPSSAQGLYPQVRYGRSRGRELAMRAAVGATIVGLIMGVSVGRYCRSEGTPCPRAAFGYFVYGAAIGAAVGVATGR
jgi:hypothetical protein